MVLKNTNGKNFASYIDFWISTGPLELVIRLPIKTKQTISSQILCPEGCLLIHRIGIFVDGKNSQKLAK